MRTYKFVSEPQLGVGIEIDGKTILGYGTGSGFVEWSIKREKEIGFPLNYTQEELFTRPLLDIVIEDRFEESILGISRILLIREPLNSNSIKSSETFNYVEKIDIESGFHPSRLFDKLKELNFKLVSEK